VSTFASIIREDEKRKAEERLEALLLEGLQGEESELTRDDWTVFAKRPGRALRLIRTRK